MYLRTRFGIKELCFHYSLKTMLIGAELSLVDMCDKRANINVKGNHMFCRLLSICSLMDILCAKRQMISFSLRGSNNRK